MPSLVDAARDLRPVVDANARRHPDGPVPRATVEALVEAGLHAVNVPAAVGGAEASFTDTTDVFAEIAYADGSAGWNLMATATTTAFFGAWAGDECVEKLFADGVPLTAGQFAPNGTARRDGDEWVVNGSYQFGSGIDAATWVGAGTLTEDDPPDLRFFIFGADQIERTGNWEVMGLRATASEDYLVRDVRVADAASFPFVDPPRRRGGPIYELGVLGLVTMGHTGFAIGVVRRALDELRAIAATKHRLGAPTPLRDSERFAYELGELSARAEAARVWAQHEFAAAQARLEAEPHPDPVLTNRLRAVTAHVTHDGADVVRSAYLLAGTSALRTGPLERAMRDIHAGTQHFYASPGGLIDHARDLLATPVEPPAGTST